MLIHCKEGAHRGPFASAVWLMAKTGRSMHEVVKYLEQLRCLVHLRPDVKDRLRHHDRELSLLFRDLRAGQVYHGGPWADQPLPAIMSSDELLRHLDRDKKQHKEPDKEPDNEPAKEPASGQVPAKYSSSSSKPDPPASGQSSASGQVPPSSASGQVPPGQASGQVSQEEPAAQSPAFGHVPQEKTRCAISGL